MQGNKARTQQPKMMIFSSEQQLQEVLSLGQFCRTLSVWEKKIFKQRCYTMTRGKHNDRAICKSVFKTMRTTQRHFARVVLWLYAMEKFTSHKHWSSAGRGQGYAKRRLLFKNLTTQFPYCLENCSFAWSPSYCAFSSSKQSRHKDLKLTEFLLKPQNIRQN